MGVRPTARSRSPVWPPRPSDPADRPTRSGGRRAMGRSTRRCSEGAWWPRTRPWRGRSCRSGRRPGRPPGASRPSGHDRGRAGRWAQLPLVVLGPRGGAGKPGSVRRAAPPTGPLPPARRAPDGLSRSFQLPFGTLPGAAFIGLRTTDVLTHAWDLAQATGQSTDLDPELAAEALEASQERISPAFRGPGRPFGEQQPCPEGRSKADELAAFLRRVVS